MSAESAERVGQGVSQGIFAASAAVNAIPIAGQFASAGLAIAGLMVKLFAGKKQRKKEEARRAAEADRTKQETVVGNQAAPQSIQGGGLQATSALPSTTNFQAQSTPMFKGGGGTEPTIAPTQQALNNRLF